LVAGRAFDRKGVYVWYNDGRGGFTETLIPGSGSYYSGTPADLDRDLDLVGAGGYSHGKPVQIYWNRNR